MKIYLETPPLTPLPKATQVKGINKTALDFLDLQGTPTVFYGCSLKVIF